MELLVCIKQVPDTSEIKLDPETNNLIRTGLPSIVNPDDMHALEAALAVKDQYEGSRVTVLSMGPPQAEAALRECLSLGADDAVLVTDRAFGGADTLATSYTIASAIRHIQRTMNRQFQIIFCGKQAIDGDTAQVGPQVAEKLGLPQVTYAEDILKIDAKSIEIKRRLERGVETVVASMPLVVTVNGSSAPCRPRNAKLLQRYKYARTASETKDTTEEIKALLGQRPGLHIVELGAAEVGADLAQCGLSGSPTKVKHIESVVFQAKEARRMLPEDGEIEALMQELIANHTIG